jgi:uncharacterized protein YprB with RNaseH-like and TPR domain/predicted nuclease with RNAse H fold
MTRQASEGADRVRFRGSATKQLSMIESTFVHIPGIGHRTERQLWKSGVTSWDCLEERLAAGVRIHDLLHSNGYYQPSLFPEEALEPDGSRLSGWLQTLEMSRKALRECDFAFFLDRLDPRDHWRVLATQWKRALFLDIETTGLARDFHYTTVIGAMFEGRFYQWVWPEPLKDFFQLISQASLVVSFNGRRFDVPFLARQFSAFVEPKAHVDLLDAARALGYSGGQKEVELILGLERDQSVVGVGGEEAVQLWSRTLYGDENSFQRLLRYNRADVEMLPRIAEVLCRDLWAKTFPTKLSTPERVLTGVQVRSLPSFLKVRDAWQGRRAGLHKLLPTINQRLSKSPVVVGIDLRGNPRNPTGWALCIGESVQTNILYDDEAVLRETLAAKPAVVSIDAPLFLPRGRHSVLDGSPCRVTGGIVREVERVLWSRGIPVYPALIKHMQGLTKRGMEIADILREHGLTVIESYPGAAQDILGIARKGKDPTLLERGLKEFGFQLAKGRSHDELDAVTSALVAYYYLADEYEAIGADDEGFMIVPRIPLAMRWTGSDGT